MKKYAQVEGRVTSLVWLARMLGGLAISFSGNAFSDAYTVTSTGYYSQYLSGNMLITQSMGTLSGSNLFHGFRYFNINSGETATFTTSTAGIANVFARVTGPYTSYINGALTLTQCTGCAAPNFFLINPSGVTFGSGASINVPGAFHVSTADYIKFSNGNFYADATKSSTFSSAAPEAFGFLGTQSAAINVWSGATLATTGTLKPISVIAGNVDLYGGYITTKGSDIRVLALGQQAATVPLTGTLPAATGTLSIYSGYIYGTTTGTTGTGAVTVGSGSLTIDGGTYNNVSGILNYSDTGSMGTTGAVSVTVANALSLLRSGQISSNTATAQDAGAVTVNAGSISINGSGTSNFTGIRSNPVTGSTGNAGAVTVTSAGTLSVANGGYITSSTQTAGNAGTVNVTSSGALTVSNGGFITSDTYSSGKAGLVKVSSGSISIDGNGTETGITSIAKSGSSGSAGGVEISTGGLLSIINGGAIASTTFASGSAGNIKISAGSLSMDQKRYGSFTGITSQAGSGSTGNAGAIDLTVQGAISLLGGVEISSNTFSAGNAGAVTVQAGSLTMDGAGGTQHQMIGSNAEAGLGNAGNVSVTVTGGLTLKNSGSNNNVAISSRTYTAGNAGKVTVNAGSISASGSSTSIDSNTSSTGKAGAVSVSVGNLSLTNNAVISSRTSGSGDAGTVTVQAADITIDGAGALNNNVQAWTSIYSGVSSCVILGCANATGNAGSVDITATGTIAVLNGGNISSRTRSVGAAGTVNIKTKNLIVDGSNASDGTHSFISAEVISVFPTGGQAGSVSIVATDNVTLSNGGEIRVTNDATITNAAQLALIKPTVLSIKARNLTLKNAKISTASTGNVAASEIKLDISNDLFIDPSVISTSSNLGNGGAITINAGNNISLIESQITTSVTGTTGNGGNISITGKSLIMNSGFIQANTAAKNAAGGTIAINVNSLVPSSNTLYLGGNTAYTYQKGMNVIQAAAPTGVSGTIQATTPVLDAMSSLTLLNTQAIDTGGLGRSPCQVSGGSSLAQTGRGGLPPSARGLLRGPLHVEPSSSFIKTGYSIIPTIEDGLRLASSNWGCS